jgi:chromosome segregation ATPase
MSATPSPPDNSQEITQRFAWMDEERRKVSRKLVEMEQRLELQSREIATRDQRIHSLEQELVTLKAKMAGTEQFDHKLSQMRKEFATQLDELGRRQGELQHESERVRQIENSNLTRELAAVRKELPAIPRLQADIEQRKVEEVRLSQALAAIQNRFMPLDNRIDAAVNQTTYLAETSRQTARQVADIQPQLLEITKRIDGWEARIESLSMTTMRYDAAIQTVERQQTELERQTKTWTEQARISEYNRNQQVGSWQDTFDAYKQEMAQFHKAWSKVDDQHKEVRAQLQTLTEWRRQIELQQRESAEIARVDIQRLQSRWSDFTAESDKFRKTVEVEVDQRIAGSERRQQQLALQITALDEQLEKLRREKDALARVQKGQTDAIRRLPNIWAEEVDKALEADPERRRPPTKSPVPDV